MKRGCKTENYVLNYVSSKGTYQFKRILKGDTLYHLGDGKTMILIPRDIHKAVRYTGGAALFRIMHK